MQETDLKEIAHTLFAKGVQAADPATAVSRALEDRPLVCQRKGTQFIIAIGKAAGAMMKAAMERMPTDQLVRAIAVTNYENKFELPDGEVFAAAHPVPDENGLRAGQAVRRMVFEAGPDDHVLCLISGGGSALLPAPRAGVTLADKIEVNKILLAGGFDILQTNLVRQNLSDLKGGGLARLAAPAKVRSLILSDVIGDDPSAIASGPTAPPLGSAQDAIDILRSKGAWEAMPASVKAVLSKAPRAQASLSSLATNEVICSNMQTLKAIAQAAKGWSPRIVSGHLEGDVEDAVKSILSEANLLQGEGPKLLIWGGETTVTLKGDGKGGRNQELALRFAQEAQTLPGNWLFLSGGTDGRDGPTKAAGGIVDAGTVKRIRDNGGDITALLGNNDSNQALKLSGDLLVTGATGTNVADVQLLFLA